MVEDKTEKLYYFCGYIYVDIYISTVRIWTLNNEYAIHIFLNKEENGLYVYFTQNVYS